MLQGVPKLQIRGSTCYSSLRSIFALVMICDFKVYYHNLIVYNVRGGFSYAWLSLSNMLCTFYTFCQVMATICININSKIKARMSFPLIFDKQTFNIMGNFPCHEASTGEITQDRS